VAVATFAGVELSGWTGRFGKSSRLAG